MIRNLQDKHRVEAVERSALWREEEVAYRRGREEHPGLEELETSAFNLLHKVRNQLLHTHFIG